MMAEVDPTVLGYHGTSSSMNESILNEGFLFSKNIYDWLGDGIYFFQDGPQRAWEWAVEHRGDNAAVVGAEIRLINCLDLLDTKWTTFLTEVYDNYIKYIKAADLVRPKQTSGAHRLDRDVINYAVGVLVQQGIEIGCVRAVFIEGQQVFSDSALYGLAHVQIAVRQTDRCISRAWLEKGIESGR